jgi:hypothetical protein
MKDIRKVTGLLASSATLDGIAGSVSRFYCGESITLLARGPKAWAVADTYTGQERDRVRVILKGGRYRFEMLEPSPEPAPQQNYAIELTPAGEQAVIPGCERNLAPATRQLNLFG